VALNTLYHNLIKIICLSFLFLKFFFFGDAPTSSSGSCHHTHVTFHSLLTVQSYVSILTNQTTALGVYLDFGIIRFSRIITDWAIDMNPYRMLSVLCPPPPPLPKNSDNKYPILIRLPLSNPKLFAASLLSTQH
jgi:hypothetical protein